MPSKIIPTNLTNQGVGGSQTFFSNTNSWAELIELKLGGGE